jgi:subtilisin family serine protease
MTRPVRNGSALVACALFLAGCAESPSEVSAPQDLAATVVPRHSDGQYFVRYNAAFPPRSLATTIAQAGGSVVYDFAPIGFMVVRGLTQAAANRLDARGDILGVAPDYALQWIPREPLRLAQKRRTTNRSKLAADQSSAFFFADQWNLRNVGVPVAWRETKAGAGALVCVLDTGIDPGQLDLVGKVDISRSTSFIPSEPFIEDLNAHGTFIAALISSNGIGIGSVAPEATLCAVKVLDFTGIGNFSAVVAGLFHSALVGADVANLSLTAYIPKTLPGVDVLRDVLRFAVQHVRELGVSVIAAAGNDGINLDADGDNIVLPAETPRVISVAANAPFAQMNFDALASYSNFGGVLGGVDITAPGGDLLPGGNLIDLILSACSRFVCGGDGFYVFGSGTSFASPHVAAIAALTESVLPGNQTADELDGCLLRNAMVIRDASGARDNRYGVGRVHAVRAGLCLR